MSENCPNCGKPLRKGYLFCGKCGYKLSQEIIQKEKSIEKEIVEEIEKNKKIKTKQPEKIKKETSTEKEPLIRNKNKTKWIVAVFVLIIIFTIVVVGISYSLNISDSSKKSGEASNGDSHTPPTSEDFDKDGYNDDVDAFPYDPSEWKDSDNDGYGDNSDAFPYDSSEHLDSDSDGVGDKKDVFPYNPDETKDTDNDGIGDNADIDDDNDGYADSTDYLPYTDAKIKISILEFAIWDEIDIDFWPSTREGEIYFEIKVNNVKEARFPSTGTISADIQTYISAPSDWYIIINLDDDKQKHSINIVMYDDDTISQEILDIDGSDDTEGLTISYDIVTNSWTGDDIDGVTDGRNDGTYSSDDNDAYLEYEINSV